MAHFHIKSWLAILCAVLLPTPVVAESFEEALKLALQNNPTLQAEKYRYMATRQQQIIAISAALPQVSAFARRNKDDKHTRNYITGTDVENLAEHSSDAWGLNATMDVFTSGQNLSEFLKTRADIRAQNLSFKATEQNVLLSAISTYLSVVNHRAVLSLRQKNVAVLRRQYEAVRDQFDVGLLTRTDLAQSETRLKLAQSNFIQQKAALEAARAEYKEIIGQLPGKLTAPKKLPALPFTLDDALRLARAYNPTLLQAQEQSRSADHAAHGALAGSLPKVRLYGNYTVTEDPKRNLIGQEEEVTNIGLEVSMPVFVGGQNFAAIRASRHVKSTSKNLVHAANNRLEREVTIAWHNLDAAKGQIDASRLQIKAAEIALEGVKQEQELGTRTILELLDAEEELLDARVALIESERARIIAAYTLLAALGGLTGAQLNLVDPEPNN